MNIIEAAQLFNLDKDIKLKRRSKEITITFHPLGKHFMKDDSYSIYLTTVDDILANDWYAIKREILYPFEEAIASLRKGKSIRRKAWINRFSVDADDNNYYFTIDDLNANDWIIKERKNNE